MDVTVGYQIAPAQCFCCGSGDQTRVVLDTGEHPLAIKRFRIYLCELCVNAAAKRVADYKGQPWLSYEAAAELQGLVAAASTWQDRAEAAERKLADLAALVSDL